jgi:medium-chain acyl-[acyl-carrier-protein] hydrolase
LLPDLDRPYALFGHSMGAIVAFEAARSLRARYGIEPVHLFISGRRPPHLPGKRWSIHTLAEREFLNEVKAMGGAPPEIFDNADIMELMTPVLRADFEMIENYRYDEGEPLSCPVTAFGGLEDPDIPPDCLEEWRSHTTGRFSMHMVPGDHFFIRTARRLVLARLATELHFAES